MLSSFSPTYNADNVSEGVQVEEYAAPWYIYSIYVCINEVITDEK